jgi:hypothetical protein
VSEFPRAFDDGRQGRSLEEVEMMPRVRRPQLGAMASATALVAALSFGATAAADNGQPPGSDQNNPITQIGPPSTTQTYVDIFWSDGSTETVRAKGQPSRETAEKALSERAKAEGRKGQGGRTASDSGGGSTACSWSIGGPYKASSTKAAAVAAVSCTIDVSNVNGTLYLFRSANLSMIGFDSEGGGRNVAWSTSGKCLASTWQYNAELVYSFASIVNGTHFPPGHWNGPVWISC